jgi:Fic family protein
MLSLLSTADRALGRLDGATDTLPNPDLFVMMYIKKEAVLSSQIEGTQASLVEVLELEANVLNPKHPTDVEEVVNYVNALNFGLARLRDLPLSLRLLCEIHGHLLKGTRGQAHNPGEFRRSQNWIGPAGCTLTTARFVPPPPDAMKQALADLELFLHDESPMPLLLRIGLAHAQFETIHPFLDGNGRIGRLLITFLLCEKEVLHRPLLYLSYYFKQNRTEYYDRLQAVRDRGDWEGWMKFFLAGVAAVADEAARIARKIVSLREEGRERIIRSGGRATADGLKLHEQLFQSPVITIQGASECVSKQFPAASRLVRQLVDLRILVEVSGKERNRVYLHREYLSLFDDDEVALPSLSESTGSWS